MQRVLDVGTGTGIWAMDYGDEHPEAEEVSHPPVGIDMPLCLTTPRSLGWICRPSNLPCSSHPPLLFFRPP